MADAVVNPYLLIPALIALIAGLVIHSFIIGVNVSDWWRGRSVTPVDHIVTSLGISRICAQFAYFVGSYVIILFLGFFDTHLLISIMVRCYAFFTYANIWITSLLSIVLCLKISNLHTRLFLYLRRMILHRTGCLIGASLLLSIMNSLTTWILNMTVVPKGNSYKTPTANVSTDCIYTNSMYSFIIGAFCPLVFYCISSVLLFVSLYHHTTRMKMSSNLSINLETYYSVMKLVSFTFIYNTLFFFGHVACVIYYFSHCVTLHLLYFFLDVLPVLHSSYLIYRTTKLRNQMSKVLNIVVDFLFQRKDTETIENMEVIGE